MAYAFIYIYIYIYYPLNWNLPNVLCLNSNTRVWLEPPLQLDRVLKADNSIPASIKLIIFELASVLLLQSLEFYSMIFTSSDV